MSTQAIIHTRHSGRVCRNLIYGDTYLLQLAMFWVFGEKERGHLARNWRARCPRSKIFQRTDNNLKRYGTGFKTVPALQHTANPVSAKQEANA